MSDIPKTCKAAVLEEYGKPLQIREVEIPEIGPKAVLVKVLMAGICGTDVHQQRGELTIKSPLPNIQGHETVGRIVKLGEGRVKDAAGEELKVGDRIMWAHADCGECYWCNIARDPVLCAKRSGYGWAPPVALRGGFAEYEYISPLTNVIKVPEELTEEEAVGVGCAFRSVLGGYDRFGKVGLMEDFVIQGCGPIGLYSTVVARESGARTIIVVGAPANRLELAKKWGADHVIDIDVHKDAEERRQMILELTQGRGPGNVVEASGYPPAVAEGLEMVMKGGKYLILGQTSAAATPIIVSRINEKGLTIVGSVSAHIVHFYQALQFIKTNRNKYPFAEIVSGTYQLEDVNDALANMASGKEIKSVIDNRGR
jgi:L-iditol 2-dehydrogenase